MFSNIRLLLLTWLLAVDLIFAYVNLLLQIEALLPTGVSFFSPAKPPGVFQGPPNLLSNWLEQLFSQGYSDGGLKVRAPSSDNAKNKWSYTSSTKYAGIKRYVIEYRKCYCYRPIFMNIITTELTANKIFFVIAHNRLIFSKWKYTLTASVMGCRLAWYECNKTFE